MLSWGGGLCGEGELEGNAKALKAMHSKSCAYCFEYRVQSTA